MENEKRFMELMREVYLLLAHDKDKDRGEELSQRQQDMIDIATQMKAWGFK